MRTYEQWLKKRSKIFDLFDCPMWRKEYKKYVKEFKEEQK